MVRTGLLSAGVVSKSAKKISLSAKKTEIMPWILVFCDGFFFFAKNKV